MLIKEGVVKPVAHAQHLAYEVELLTVQYLIVDIICYRYSNK